VAVGRQLGRGDVLGGLEDGAALRVVRPVLVGLVLGAARQVVAVRLAALGVGGEPVVGVEALAAVGKFGVAGPLHAAAPAQLLVAEPAGLAGAAGGHELELLEGLLGSREGEQRS